MNAFHSKQQPPVADSAAEDFLRQIRNGDVARLTRFIVEPTEDGHAVRTLIIAKSSSLRYSRFPMVAAFEHKDDQQAMAFALQLFDELKAAGLASTSEVAVWRRGLFAVVPASQ